jgi:hypothetical protein
LHHAAIINPAIVIAMAKADCVLANVTQVDIHHKPLEPTQTAIDWTFLTVLGRLG